MDLLTFALAGLAGLVALMTLLWLLSLVLRDASIVDRFWGLTFVLQAVIYGTLATPLNLRMIVMLTLIVVWGVRLSLHIHVRARGHGEDYRYKAMRDEHGDAKFWWYSYFSVFMLQGLLSFVIATPLLMVFYYRGPDALTYVDYLAILIWGIGFFFESVSDYQLVKFKKLAANKGKLLTHGLWSLCRHPNYFGDALLWWGFFLFALEVEYGIIAVVGPLVMSLLIYFVSGVRLLEKDLVKRKPGYKVYIETTPAFFPKRISYWLSFVLLFCCIQFFLSCATPIPRKDTVGKAFPEVSGKALDDKVWQIPKDLAGENSVLLVGYKQNSQFDIDRWLIGFDQFQLKAPIFEIPTVSGMIPGLIANKIDAGMRSGIPSDLWKAVITIYEDADKVIDFTGNEDPLNARVMVLDKNGQVVYMHDRGFSVGALRQLLTHFPNDHNPKQCE